MTQDTLDIDCLVRRVLADLGLTPPPSPRDGALPEQEAESKQSGDVVVSGRVVALSALEGRLGSAERLVVPLGAVVTPSVRDELRRRGIPLVFEAKKQAKPAGDHAVTLAVLGSRFEPSSLAEALGQEGIAHRVERFDCLVAATDAMAQRLSEPAEMVVLVSTYPAVALCLANRHSGVRAVLGLDSPQVANEAASVGANLLVVDPRRVPAHLLRQVVSDFCRTGARECPDKLKERLG